MIWIISLPSVMVPMIGALIILILNWKLKAKLCIHPFFIKLMTFYFPIPANFSWKINFIAFRLQCFCTTDSQIFQNLVKIFVSKLRTRINFFFVMSINHWNLKCSLSQLSRNNNRTTIPTESNTLVLHCELKMLYVEQNWCFEVTAIRLTPVCWTTAGETKNCPSTFSSGSTFKGRKTWQHSFGACGANLNKNKAFVLQFVLDRKRTEIEEKTKSSLIPCLQKDWQITSVLRKNYETYYSLKPEGSQLISWNNADPRKMKLHSSL